MTPEQNNGSPRNEDYAGNDLVDLVLEARDGGRKLTTAELTRVAQELATGTATTPLADACAGCGDSIPQKPGRGRPRKWCGRGRCAKNGKNP